MEVRQRYYSFEGTSHTWSSRGDGDECLLVILCEQFSCSCITCTMKFTYLMMKLIYMSSTFSKAVAKYEQFHKMQCVQEARLKKKAIMII